MVKDGSQLRNHSHVALQRQQSGLSSLHDMTNFTRGLVMKLTGQMERFIGSGMVWSQAGQMIKGDFKVVAADVLISSVGQVFSLTDLQGHRCVVLCNWQYSAVQQMQEERGLIYYWHICVTACNVKINIWV